MSNSDKISEVIVRIPRDTWFCDYYTESELERELRKIRKRKKQK